MSDTSEAPAPAEFAPYPCSLGLVTGHDGDTYLVTIADGRTIGIRANGEPSPANVEADIANPPPVPTAPPKEIPLWAFRQVLIEDGLLDVILSAVAGNAVLVNYLEYGNFVDRNSPSLAAIATQLGKTDAEVDDIFRRAGAKKI